MGSFGNSSDTRLLYALLVSSEPGECDWFATVRNTPQNRNLAQPNRLRRCHRPPRYFGHRCKTIAAVDLLLGDSFEMVSTNVRQVSLSRLGKEIGTTQTLRIDGRNLK